MLILATSLITFTFYYCPSQMNLLAKTIRILFRKQRDMRHLNCASFKFVFHCSCLEFLKLLLLLILFSFLQVRKMVYVQGNSVPLANHEVLDKLIAARHELAQVANYMSLKFIIL